MRDTLLRIALVSGLVLSLFLLLLWSYLRHEDFQSGTHERNGSVVSARFTEKNDTLPGATKALPQLHHTSSAQIKALLTEENRSLESRYKSVASEIEDFAASLKEHNRSKSRLQERNRTQFTSSCPLPPTDMSVAATPPKHAVSEKKRATPSPKEKMRKKVLPKRPNRPRLVIIMDDVSTMEQGRMIQSLPLKVTPSIFPVSATHPHTQDVAKLFSCYMVHTPMEAYHYPREEENTLKTDDTFEKIDRTIARIKRDFPRLTAINNHTGSRFTSDDAAMDRLFCALRKYRIKFIDSRTSAATVAKEIAKLHGEKIFSRNIFLDNVDSVHAITARLKESVQYARKHGTAIAICHPRPNTFRALQQAKRLVRGVDIVTVDKLYR